MKHLILAACVLLAFPALAVAAPEIRAVSAHPEAAGVFGAPEQQQTLQQQALQQLQSALAQANAVIAALREQRQECLGQTMDQQAAALAQQMLAQAAAKSAPAPAAASPKK